MSGYVEQPYDSSKDPGTGDFYYLFWLKEAANSAIGVIFERDSVTTAQRVAGQVNADGTVSFICDDDTTVRTATTTGTVDDDTYHLIMFNYSSGILNIYIDNVLDGTATGTALLTLSNTSAILRIGLDVQGANPLTNGSLTLFRAGHNIPSSGQLAEIYNQEKKLFEENAEFLLPSDNVQALDFDEAKQILSVGTDAGLVAYKDLLKITDYFDNSLSVSSDIVSVSSFMGQSLIGTAAQSYFLAPQTYTIDPDLWANVALDITISTVQNVGANSLWVSLGDPIYTSVILSITLTDAYSDTLYAGVIRANLAQTYGSDPDYGLRESRVDYSIKAENSNGSWYYNKRDIVRTFNLRAFVTREKAQLLIDSFDTLGQEPSAWKLTDIDSSDWVVFGKFDGPPVVLHDHPEHSIIEWSITEVL